MTCPVCNKALRFSNYSTGFSVAKCDSDKNDHKFSQFEDFQLLYYCGFAIVIRNENYPTEIKGYICLNELGRDAFKKYYYKPTWNVVLKDLEKYLLLK